MTELAGPQEVREPYEVGTEVQLANSCHAVSGTVEAYELLREARPWRWDDRARYRYQVRWSNWPDEPFSYTSSQLRPALGCAESGCC